MKNSKIKLPKGVMLHKEAEDISMSVVNTEEGCVTPSLYLSEDEYNGEESYIDLRTNAPDGHYQAAEFTFRWDREADDYGKYRWWVSKTLVKVEDGILDLRTLVKACSEIRVQHGYHGRFLEVVEYEELVNIKFSGRQGYLNIGWGS